MNVRAFSYPFQHLGKKKRLRSAALGVVCFADETVGDELHEKRSDDNAGAADQSNRIRQVTNTVGCNRLLRGWRRLDGRGGLL